MDERGVIFRRRSFARPASLAYTPWATRFGGAMLATSLSEEASCVAEAYLPVTRTRDELRSLVPSVILYSPRKFAWSARTSSSSAEGREVNVGVFPFAAKAVRLAAQRLLAVWFKVIC